MVKRSLMPGVSRCRPRVRGCRLRVGVFMRAELLSGLHRGEAVVERSMVRKMGTCRRVAKCMMFCRLEICMRVVKVF